MCLTRKVQSFLIHLNSNDRATKDAQDIQHGSLTAASKQIERVDHSGALSQQSTRPTLRRHSELRSVPE